jgi:hypothetical protein
MPSKNKLCIAFNKK